MQHIMLAFLNPVSKLVFLHFSIVIVTDLLVTETVIRKFEEEDLKNLHYKMVKKSSHCSF